MDFRVVNHLFNYRLNIARGIPESKDESAYNKNLISLESLFLLS